MRRGSLFKINKKDSEMRVEQVSTINSIIKSLPEYKKLGIEDKHCEEIAKLFFDHIREEAGEDEVYAINLRKIGNLYLSRPSFKREINSNPSKKDKESKLHEISYFVEQKDGGRKALNLTTMEALDYQIPKKYREMLPSGYNKFDVMAMMEYLQNREIY